MTFSYCPKCGRKLIMKEIGDEGDVPFCAECSRPFFDFSYPCVICLVTDGAGEFLLIKQGYVSENHVCVAGYIKRGETAEEAATREVAEETGLSVRSVRYISGWYHEKSDNLMLGFVVTAEHGDYALSGEVDSAGWFGAEKARELLSGSRIAKKLLDAVLSE